MLRNTEEEDEGTDMNKERGNGENIDGGFWYREGEKEPGKNRG